MNFDAIRIVPIPTQHAERYWLGEADVNGQIPETHVSDGAGVPCRHCLCNVEATDPYLILAYRPFPEIQPYAESGPIFLHAKPCKAYPDNGSVPPMFLKGEPRIVRAYDSTNCIVYGTGKVVRANDIAIYAKELLIDPSTAYVHVRSSENNCYSFRIDRVSVGELV